MPASTLWRAQMDSARTDNKMLLTTLRRVTNESKEYQRLYKEQRTLVDKLRDEITRVKAGARHADRTTQNLLRQPQQHAF